MTPAQCKMARAGIGMGVRELASAAKVSTNTITRFEAGDELRDRTVDALQAALEAAGAIFVAENGDGPGVRLRKASTAAAVAERIEALEAKAASIPEAVHPSPEAAMNTMKKAVVENELVGLRNKRKRLKHRDDPGR